MAFLDFLKPLMIKAPELTYFDHLLGEFESLETALTAAPPTTGHAPDAPVTSPPDAAAYTSPPDAELAGQTALTTQRMLAEARRKVEALKVKRRDQTVDWNDLYLMEMLLADLRPVGTLRAKVLSLRRDYRSVAGQVEYDEYLASKPKNLLDPPDPRDPPDTNANYGQLLRDDLKDLLGRLFKRYAFLPIREARLKRLTIYASLFCGLFLLIMIGFILSMNPDDGKPDGARASANANTARRAAGGANTNANTNANDNRAAANTAQAAEGGRWRPWPSIALFVVLVSGAMGGFVSALQRVQSSPTEGDSVYNLVMLYHGSYAVFVAPLTGAIFGILLYMMFTGNVLEGRFFPSIYTPAALTRPAQANAATARRDVNANTDAGNSNATASNGNANTRGANNANTANVNTANVNTANVNTANTNSTNSNLGNSNLGNSNGGSGANGNTGEQAEGEGAEEGAGTETVTTAPTPQQVPTASLGVREFLYSSGPAGGEDYALLIIWSFIAGFAERFVPDSLNRLIANK
jgi:hypothetical protein